MGKVRDQNCLIARLLCLPRQRQRLLPLAAGGVVIALAPGNGSDVPQGDAHAHPITERLAALVAFRKETPRLRQVGPLPGNPAALQEQQRSSLLVAALPARL